MRSPCLFALLAVSAALTACTPPAQEPEAADPFAGIPNVRFLYYDVSGGSAAEIRRSIVAGRGDTRHYDASTSWRFKWRWGVDRASGTCALANVQLAFGADVRLPRLTHPERLAPRLRAQWEHYYVALRKHEAGHANYPYAHSDEVLAAIKGSDCAHASEAAKAVLARFTARDRAYDAETDHGAAQGATFP